MLQVSKGWGYAQIHVIIIRVDKDLEFWNREGENWYFIVEFVHVAQVVSLKIFKGLPTYTKLSSKVRPWEVTVSDWRRSWFEIRILFNVLLGCMQKITFSNSLCGIENAFSSFWGILYVLFVHIECLLFLSSLPCNGHDWWSVTAAVCVIYTTLFVKNLLCKSRLNFMTWKFW